MANPLASLSLLRSHPELGGLAVVMTLYYLAHQVLPSIFVLFAVYRFNWNEKMVGWSLAAVGIAVSKSWVRWGWFRPIVKKIGERSSVLLGLTFGVMSFLGFAAGVSGLDGVRGDSLSRLVGDCRAVGAVDYVAARRSHIARKTARRD